MTPQEIFDTVAKALIKQGKASLTPGGACVYRASDGSKCAVGHLLPDTAYLPEMDTQSLGVADLLAKHGDSLPMWMHDHKSLLMELQDCHDAARNHFLRDWVDFMYETAADNGLDPSSLNAVDNKGKET